MRARPLSITVETPGTVSEVSAIADERITRRFLVSFKTRFCSSNEMLECKIQSSLSLFSSNKPVSSKASCALRMSEMPGRNTRMFLCCTGLEDDRASRTALTTLFSGSYKTRTGNCRPGTLNTGVSPQSPRYSCNFFVSIVADIITTNKSSRNSIASFKNARARSVFTDLS